MFDRVAPCGPLEVDEGNVVNVDSPEDVRAPRELHELDAAAEPVARADCATPFALVVADREYRTRTGDIAVYGVAVAFADCVAALGLNAAVLERRKLNEFVDDCV